MKRILAFFAVTMLTTGLFGQQVEVLTVKHTQEFGFHAGATTGVGLSYRYWPGKNGVQLTALPIKTNDYVFINLGLTALHTFYDSNYFRFFGYLGSSVSVNNDDLYYDSGSSSDRNARVNVGIGPGFAFGSRVRFNIMAGYGFYDVLGQFNIYPTGEIGLYFRL
jgi:hypothetical protein